MVIVMSVLRVAATDYTLSIFKLVYPSYTVIRIGYTETYACVVCALTSLLYSKYMID
jgi:hypothetical protein